MSHWAIALGLSLILAGACRSVPLAPGPPAGYRIEAETFTLETDDAERIWLPLDERECALAAGVDAREKLSSAIAELERQGRVGPPRRWVTRTIGAGRSERLAAPPELQRALELSLRPMWRDAWAPLVVEMRVVWRAADGEPLAELPEATFPVPAGATLRIVCLPARARGPRHALVTFVRVVPEPRAP